MQTIFYDGVCKAGGYIADRGSFAQYLLDFGIHEYRASGSQIARTVRQAGQSGKLGNFVP